ncbi:MAG: APC family permease [Verrucomicrobia bacterium]|nr:MAG: APC family permease [Verrucomicrobiota bacterium]
MPIPTTDPLPADPTVQPQLERRLGLFPATALNMANMLGAGPFITISTLMSALGGPQSMLGWLIALAIALPDGMVWAELGAAMPGSGGTFRYLLEGFGARTWGRLMAFLFLAQLLVSGPLEIASGYIGFLRYLGYLWPGVMANDLPTWKGGAVLVVLGLAMIVLLYRRIESIARLTVALWIGVVITVAGVLATGLWHFDARLALDVPPDAWRFNWGFAMGLGAAARTGIYDFLGYYGICYLGDEVKNPGRNIPRSVLLSLVVVAVIYVGVNLSIIGSVPWRTFVPESEHPEALHVVSAFMERLHGRGVAAAFTLMVLWTCVGSCFALLLGYSRIPYAAAKEGVFFRVFARLHPTRHFPHVALLLLGGLAIAASFVKFSVVLDTLVALRIVVQFLGQVVAVVLLRRRRPEMPRPYRMWLYPLPLVLSAAGWLFVFGTLDPAVLKFVGAAVAAGVGSFLAWSRWNRVWPFEPSGK